MNDTKTEGIQGHKGAAPAPIIIAVDFDGTLCEDKHPDIGQPNMPLIKDLIMRRELGDKLILWTCRENDSPKYPGLQSEAVGWCKSFGLRFDAVNANLPEVIAKYGGDCRKPYADLYIDDRAMSPVQMFGRPGTDAP